jgi:4'-phosphopantetheinyl transferase
MDIHWLEQSAADVPVADDWLSENEVVQLSRFRFAKRRADWRLGRWTAKRAIAASLDLADDHWSLTKIEINAAATGQPKVTLVGRTDHVTISISHCKGIAVCAVAFGDASLGCDLEVIESRGDNFVFDYFTAEEQESIAQIDWGKRAALVTLLWSAKESALKALQVGLRADTRSVTVEIPSSPSHWLEDAVDRSLEAPNSIRPAGVPSNQWRPLQVRCADDSIFHGWWYCRNDSVRTIVAAPSPATPQQLSLHDEEPHQQGTTVR